jgi:tautomerase-like protein
LAHPANAVIETHIEITLFAGRSINAKRLLYKTIVRNLATFDVPARDVKIVLIEVPAENTRSPPTHELVRQERLSLP